MDHHAFSSLVLEMPEGGDAPASLGLSPHSTLLLSSFLLFSLTGKVWESPGWTPYVASQVPGGVCFLLPAGWAAAGHGPVRPAWVSCCCVLGAVLTGEKRQSVSLSDERSIWAACLAGTVGRVPGCSCKGLSVQWVVIYALCDVSALFSCASATSARWMIMFYSLFLFFCPLSCKPARLGVVS